MKYPGLFLLFALVATSHQLINYRLPTNSIPHHYEIKLTPHINPDNPKFEGKSEISLEVLKPTKNLTLHASKLEINKTFTTLIGERGNIEPSEHVIDVEPEFLILVFRQNIQPGNYKLQLKFSGMLNNYNTGFFISYYRSEDNDRVYFVSTFFEATQARQAFPCWDEPALKATFDISIRHFPNYTALSNMPVKRKIKLNKIGGKMWTKFKTTPVMSTYLVSFMVSDFHNIVNSQGNFSVWTRKNHLNSMKFGFNVGSKALHVMEKYANISYQLPKMDIVAIPFFENGGMENWGMIVFRQDYIFRNNESSMDKKLDATQFVVHEMTHQWFGNLVSPAWWQDLWITEGIATYLQYFLTGKMTNNRRIMELFNVRNNYKVFDADYIPYLPVAPIVNNRWEIHHLLNSVHEKAATVIQMLSSFLSEDVFHSGLKKILQTYKFKAITSDDFWKTMQEVVLESKVSKTNFDIKEIMDDYLYKAGHPVVNVIRDYKTGVIKLSQKCVVCEKLVEYKDKDKAKWWIPINFATSSSLNFSSTLPTYWLNPEEKELIIEGVDPNEWIILNIQRSAHYRVNYDETNWNRIIDYLNSEKYSNIHVLNRAQLIEDASFFYTEKMLDSSVILNITSYLYREVDYIPWVAAYRFFNYYVYTPEDSKTFKESTVELLSALLKDAGLETKPNDDLFTILKRKAALDWTCRMANKNC